MTCGIYCIKNKINNKVYVGSSTNCENRFKQHKFKFLSNSHPNKHFQTSIIKYGLDNFSFEILETCLEDNLLINEDKWIKELNALNPKNGYNKKTANRIVWADELKRNHLNAVQTDEYRKLQQKITLSKWNNSRKNMFSKQFKEKWDKTESKNRNKRFNEWRGSDKQKEIMRIKTKARWNNPIEKERMIAARKLFGKTPEFKQTMSEIVTERWSNLNFKNKMSKTKTTLWKDTEFRNKMITSKHKKLGIGICSVCKKEFQKNIHNQKICSKQCRYVQKNNRRNKNKGLCTSLKSHLNIS